MGDIRDISVCFMRYWRSRSILIELRIRDVDAFCAANLGNAVGARAATAKLMAMR